MVGFTGKVAAAVAGSVAITVGGLAVVGIATAEEGGGAGGGARERFCAAAPGDLQAEREARRTQNVADVAGELGIEPAELEAAIRAVALDRLDERLAGAVESGRLTEAEADELRAAAEAGELRELLEERHPDAGGVRARVAERIRERTC